MDVTTESYQVARQYMVRLGPRDFIDSNWVATLARAGGLGEETFRKRFGRFARPGAEDHNQTGTSRAS